MERRFEERLSCFEGKIETLINSAKGTIMLNLDALNAGLTNLTGSVTALGERVLTNMQTTQAEIDAVIAALQGATPGDQAAIAAIVGQLSQINENINGSINTVQASTDALQTELTALTPPPPPATGG